MTCRSDHFVGLHKLSDALSHGSQGLGAYRVIINANAYEGAKLLNERMGYVADSRAERDATIYTNSIEDLP